MEAEPINRLGEDVVEWPSDFTTEIPTGGPYEWVRQYIHPQEMLEHLVGWSPLMDRVIFPVFDKKHKLLMWSGRYFGKIKSAPKWYIHGKKSEHIDLMSANVLSPRVVVVEDKLSAIKVSRLVSSVCLYGTKIPLEHARTLSKTFSELVIWLDSDKRRESVVQAMVMNSLFKQVKVVFSDKDPKCYENSEIQGFLGAA